jgi:hypothetical protein
MSWWRVAFLVFSGTMVLLMVTGRWDCPLLLGTGHGCGLLVFLAPGFASGAVLAIGSCRTRRRDRRGGDRVRERVAWYLALSADAVWWSSSVRVGGLS